NRLSSSYFGSISDFKFLLYVFFFFFFFQAEDGIRDLIVTGVQTCALPISCSSAAAEELHGIGDDLDRLTLRAVLRVPLAPLEPRSEERRVGKECRSRGARYQ